MGSSVLMLGSSVAAAGPANARRGLTAPAPQCGRNASALGASTRSVPARLSARMPRGRVVRVAASQAKVSSENRKPLESATAGFCAAPRRAGEEMTSEHHLASAGGGRVRGGHRY